MWKVMGRLFFLNYTYLRPVLQNFLDRVLLIGVACGLGNSKQDYYIQSFNGRLRIPELTVYFLSN